jgi:Uma2 family endonuclease
VILEARGIVKGTSALKVGEKFTLDQWKTWPDDERWELIDGFAYGMSAAPTVFHARKTFDLAYGIRQFLENKPCEVFVAPVDVFLAVADPDSEDTVVEPDVFVVCDQGKIEKNGIHGAPDFIAETLSDSTAYKDMNTKKYVYERSGVKEYWLVSPDSGSVFQYVLVDGRYGPVKETLKGGIIESVVLKGFKWRIE